MKIGYAPPVGLAMFWSFFAGYALSRYIGPGGEITDLAIAFAWFVMGPLAWVLARSSETRRQ